MKMEIGFAGGKKVSARYQGFTIQTDQPVGDGGEGSAPSPFDMFLAAIGTCVGYYVLRFCQERSISTDAMSLSLTTKRDERSGLVGEIAIAIKLPPGFPEKYREAIIRVAEGCAVKKHLNHPPQFKIEAIVRDDQPAVVP